MNKKSKLINLAALGLVASSMATAEAARQSDSECVYPSLNEKRRLLSQLDNRHARMFNSMDCEGQNLALQLSKQECKGQNECKGLNACKTAKNTCAGLGGCGGQAPAPFEDKNQAIEVAYKKMEEKRMNSMGH